MPHRLRSQLIEGLRKASATSYAIAVGTMFSGSDICSKVLGELRRYWHSEYDVNVMFDLRFQRELDPDKRSFLEKEFPGCPVLFADASGVTEARVLNVKNGEHQRIDAVDVFIAGFACTSRSALNNKAK